MLKFKRTGWITKAFTGGDGELYLEGELTGSEWDADDEMMEPECVEDMAAQLRSSSLDVLDEHHKRGIFNELGKTAVAKLLRNGRIRLTTLLDKLNPAAREVHRLVREEDAEFGYSVAGRVLDRIKDSLGRVRYKKILLDHVGLTTKPSWKPSLGTIIAKSMGDEPRPSRVVVQQAYQVLGIKKEIGGALVKKSLSFPGICRQPLGEPQTLEQLTQRDAARPVTHFGHPEPEEEQTFVSLVRRKR